MSVSRTIHKILMDSLPSVWDGQSCILDMKQNGSSQWRQMEWIGFYFEWKARKILIDKLGGDIGPTFGNVTFDYEFNGVWDFKSHPFESNSWAYMNDVEAVNACLATKHHLGWIIACGNATYDTSGAFKKWHDALKSDKPSDYELARIRRGAPSRARKVSFALREIKIIEYTNMAGIQKDIARNLLRNDMQAGQRNSNGSDRKAKYGINIDQLISPGNDCPAR